MTSICAPCYNHEKFIPPFMESLLAQSYRDWELVVVDDCSTDGSFALLQEYAARDARVRVFRNDRNRHVCHTINRAMANASGELVTLLSCDDIFLPGKLAYDKAYFESHADVVALCAEARVFSEDGTPFSQCRMIDDFTRSHLLRCQLFGQNEMNSPGLTVRGTLIQKVGGYNPMLRMVQDHEFLTRILEHGRVAKSDRETIGYRRHSSNLSKKSDSYDNAVSNETVYFLSEHYLTGIKTVDDLVAMIPECLSYGKPETGTIPYFMARFAIENGKTPTVRYAGLLALYRFLRQEGVVDLLERKYGFLPRDFMMMSELPALETAKRLMRAESSLELIEKSLSYRLGLALTWPLRKAYRMVCPIA